MKDEFYAHSRDGKPPEEWHRLEDHLKAVAEMARQFANNFNAGDWPIWLVFRMISESIRRHFRIT